MALLTWLNAAIISPAASSASPTRPLRRHDRCASTAAMAKPNPTSSWATTSDQAEPVGRTAAGWRAISARVDASTSIGRPSWIRAASTIMSATVAAGTTRSSAGLQATSGVGRRATIPAPTSSAAAVPRPSTDASSGSWPGSSSDMPKAESTPATWATRMSPFRTASTAKADPRKRAAPSPATRPRAQLSAATATETRVAAVMIATSSRSLTMAGTTGRVTARLVMAASTMPRAARPISVARCVRAVAPASRLTVSPAAPAPGRAAARSSRPPAGRTMTGGPPDRSSGRPPRSR